MSLVKNLSIDLPSNDFIKISNIAHIVRYIEYISVYKAIYIKPVNHQQNQLHKLIKN